ncbi:MAG TPA: hypothetical protein VG496_07790, partial [Myxococcales bacterium]|nr:hypothetical protein [Myxococcales bacterium]
AVQTAEILANETKHGEVAVLEELDPKFDANELLQAMVKRADGARSVALVGHEPQLSAVLAALTAVEADALDFKKGGIVRLEARNPAERGSAAAIWSLKPRSKTVKKGLPLAKADGDGDGEEARTEERAAKGKRKKRAQSRRSAKKRSSPGSETTEASESAGNLPETTEDTAAPASGAAAGSEGVTEPVESENVSQNGPESPTAPI